MPDMIATGGATSWPSELQVLLSPATIRERCRNVFAAVDQGTSAWFRFDAAAMGAAADMVVQVARARFGDGPIAPHSRWQHFSVGGRDRVVALWPQGIETGGEGDAASLARARSLIDLVITSVLLDAGAGPAWGFVEPDGQRSTRSEGLAVASLHWFANGGFSSDENAPLRADAKALSSLTVESFRNAFQVSEDNPIVGEDRYALLVRLGERMASAPQWFSGEVASASSNVRIGGFIDWALAHATRDAAGKPTLPAQAALGWVLGALGPIWPSRTVVLGQSLGDVWPHAHAGGPGATAGLVPFHKLSQWLTYSLLAPLAVAGIAVTGIEQLTGLPEYRNGGFLVDIGVLQPTARVAAEGPFAPSHECIVEWRAATVTLLDRLLPLVRERLGKGAEFTLPMMLEAGTWECGRRLAAKRGGVPPIDIISDGTVF